MKRNIVFISTMSLLLLAGCISILFPPTAPDADLYNGRILELKQPMYLAKCGWDYTLLEEKESVVPRTNRRPTFDEFRAGKYEPKYSDYYKYTHILPAGTAFEVRYVDCSGNPEMGYMFKVYGEFVEQKAGYPRRVNLWSTFDTNAFTAYNLSFFNLRGEAAK